MLAIVREITITCFFSSYLIVLVLEVLRLLGKIPGRGLLVIVMTGIGLFTHLCYLFLRATPGVAGSSDVGVLALSLIHISEPTRPVGISRMPSSA